MGVQGLQFNFKAKSADTDGMYALTETTLPPQYEIQLHVHHCEDEALFILKGSFEIQCGDQIFTAGPGTFAFLPKDVPHRVKNLSNSPGKFLCIHSPGGVEEFVEHVMVFAKERIPVDIAKIPELAARYGVEFLATDQPVRESQ